MARNLSNTPDPIGDRAQSALDLVHRLLIRPAGDQPPLAGLLEELAGAFAADIAGLALLAGGTIAVWPGGDSSAVCAWLDDPEQLACWRQSPAAVALQRPGGGSCLVALLTALDGSPRIVWVECKRRDTWSDAEAAALPLVGPALLGWLDAPAQPRWAEQLDRAARQQRLETAADVARRLAHDFGNALTGILGFTELALSQQLPANTPLSSYLAEVHRAAQNGALFTHQLRLFSRRQSATSHGCTLGPIFAEQEARLFAARDAGVNAVFNLPADLPPAALDPEQLHQVLSALLDNAREALPGPGSISVTARLIDVNDNDTRDLYGAVRPGPHIEITIADTGVGLSPEAQKYLFADPFFTTKPRRHGFGLAVTYGILAAHHGGLRLHPGAER